MLKKITLLSFLLCLVLIPLLTSGCGDDSNVAIISAPSPTANPNISTIRGTVYDNSGQPLDGAGVLLKQINAVTGSESYGEIQEYITQNGGQYIFTVSYSGTYRIEAREGETLLESKEFTVVAGSNLNINLGNPSANLTVYVWEDINNDIPASEYTIEIEWPVLNKLEALDSEGEGWSKFENLSPGEYTIIVSHKDLVNGLEKTVQIEAGENTENINLIGWHSPITINDTYSLSSVYFTDSQNGWAAGLNNTGEGVITKTTDGGGTWSTPQIFPGTYQLYSVYFTDSLNGWVSGYNNSSEGIIAKTTDGGNNWNTQVIAGTTQLLSTYFSDNQNGWATGWNNAGEGIITKTTDGGNNWNTQVIAGTAQLRSVYFSNNQNGWAAGWNSANEGIITKTTDGGNNWNTQVIAGTSLLNSVHFIDNRNGWAVGYNENNEGIITKTADGSINWSAPQIISGTGYFSSVYFTDSQNGWTVGEDSAYIKGVAAKITDKEDINWSTEAITGTNSLSSVYFIDSQNGWAVGKNTGSEGVILKYGAISP